MLLIKNGHIKPIVGQELPVGCVLVGDDGKIISVAAAKEVGSYTATVKLHKEVSVNIAYNVVAEAESAE